MKIHVVRSGDTLQSIAQKYLYNTSRYIEIRNINNLNSEILFEGQKIKIPDSEFDTKEPYDFESIGVVIGEQKFESWFGLQINFDFSALAPSFSFSSPYEEIEPIKDALQPFSYKDIDIYYKSDLILSGVISTVKYSLSNSNTVAIGGYARAGILQFVNVPKSLYPRQQKNITLLQIAEKYCDPFRVGVDFTPEAADAMNSNFTKTEIEPTQSIADYLIRLAKEKGLIVSTAADGRLTFSKDNITGKYIVFSVDSSNSYAINAGYNSDRLYSDFTAMTSANRKKSSKTEKTTLDLDTFRHKMMIYNSDDDGNITDFVNGEKGRSLLDAMNFSLTLPFWENATGALFQPRDLITIQEPRVRIEQPTEFVVRSVTLALGAEKTAELDIVPRSALNNELERFWDE